MAVVLEKKYGAGERAAGLLPGDVVLVDKIGFHPVVWAIQLGSKVRGYGEPASHYSHAALVLSPEGDIAEALWTGVKKTNLSKYDPNEYVVFKNTFSEADRDQISAYADSVLKEKEHYGWFTFLGLALYCVTGTSLCIQKAGTAICSGLVADALTRAGIIWPRPPFAMLPAGIYDVLHESDS